MRNVMRDMESGDGYSTIRIKTALKETIESKILSKKKMGVPLYNSLADFVQIACIAEIERLKREEASA